jgi:hypothetical protein
VRWPRAPWLRSWPALFCGCFAVSLLWVQGIGGVPSVNRAELAGALRAEPDAVRDPRRAPPSTTTTTTAPPTTSTTAAPATTSADTTTTTTTTAAPPQEEASARGTFGEGLQRVGDDVAPGVYISSGELCYWERLSGTGGTEDEVIASDSTTGQSLVEIASTDVAFSSSGCAPWAPLGDAAALDSFGDGTYAVGSQVAPGSWTATGAGSCYWERLSGLGGEVELVITSGNSTTVELAGDDAAFSSFGCGTWQRA